MIADATDPAQIPAPPELVARAMEAIRQFDGQCFWYWRSDATIHSIQDIELVIQELRRNGDRKAWLAAQELKRCL
jgi:hypothetical protein